MAPIGEMAPGCAKKYKKKKYSGVFENPFAPGAISRMITVVACTVGGILENSTPPGPIIKGRLLHSSTARRDTVNQCRKGWHWSCPKKCRLMLAPSSLRSNRVYCCGQRVYVVSCITYGKTVTAAGKSLQKRTIPTWYVLSGEPECATCMKHGKG